MSAVANAATFNAYAETATIDVGNVLVNFTVNNTNADIVQVNFTLPSGFSYYGGDFGTTSQGTFTPMPTPRWYNGTTTYIIATSGNQKFWFKVTTPSTGVFPRSFEFNVSTLDTSGAFGSQNVSVTVNDLSPPKWSSNSTSPSSPSAYVSNGSYYFNITWIDNVALDDVIFEWNGATNYTNTTTPVITSLGSGKYSLTLTDLAQGNYTYKWYADDWNGAWNSTNVSVFNVTKANNPINVYFNGNLNQNLLLNSGETINATATGGGVVLYKNDTVAVNPYVDTLPRGYYVFKANSSGDYNHSTNSTGTTVYLTVVYPPPKYSISTSIPSTWYHNAYALFNITWTDNNDANGFSLAFIQLNHSGTATNYTMTRISGTTISTYELNLSMPMVLAWKVYANNSYNSWNATTLAYSNISKITPTILINVTPAWDVVRGTRTTVSCTSNQVSVILHRDGALVSNPDQQTLSTGAYVYVCNNTATTNYSTASVAKILNVFRYAANITFLEAPALITAKPNSTNSSTVVVKNIGNASYAINFTVENITSGWYTINATTATVGVNEKVAFFVNFSIAATAEVKDYAGKYKVGTVDRIVSSDFILRVLPKEQAQPEIKNDLAIYRVNMTKVWADINSSKTKGVNVTLSEQKILEAKSKLEQAESYANSGDYFSAYQLLDSIKSLIAAAETQLKLEAEAAGVTIEEEEETEQEVATDWTLWILLGAGIAVGGFLVYLLWPQSGYSEKTGRYTFKTPTARGLEAVSGTRDKIVGKIKPGPAYKTSFKSSHPSFQQPARPTFTQSKYEYGSPVKITGAEIKQPLVKTGRFTLDTGKSAKEGLAKQLSKFKDLFKRKQKQGYQEVELK